TAHGMLEKLLDSGKGMEKFQQWVEAQEGDPRIVENRELLAVAKEKETLLATRSGVIHSMNTRQIGVAANMLGAGRFKTTDKVDTTVGLKVLRKVGDEVKSGDALMTIYHNNGRG